MKQRSTVLELPVVSIRSLEPASYLILTREDNHCYLNQRSSINADRAVNIEYIIAIHNNYYMT